VDFEPPQTALAERFCFRKLQKTATEVITNVIEMRRDGISTSTEIEIVREVDFIAEELGYISK